MKKLLCILAIAALAGGVVTAIVWACCGMVIWPISITGLEDVLVPCGEIGPVSIEFTVTVDGYEDWNNYNTVEVEASVDGTAILTDSISMWTGDDPSIDYSASWTPPGAGIYDVLVVATATLVSGEVITETASAEIVVEACVPVDIKGGSCPNSVNTKGKGVLPVAILEGGDVALADIDPDSIMVGGVPVIAGMSIMEDSTAPPTGDPADCYDCFEAIDEDGDGLPDNLDGVDELVVYVDMEALAAGPLARAARDDCILLEITGQTYDGVPLVGEDSVRIVK